MKLDYAPPGRIIFSEKFACPVSRLHHRRDRAAPVQLQRAAGRLPGLRRPRREAGVRRGPRRPQPRAVDQQGRGRALGQVQPAQPLLHAGAAPASPAPTTSTSTPPWDDLPEEAQRVILHGTGGRPVTLRFIDGKPQLRGQEAVRGRHRQPQPPHAPDRERVDARGAVALPVARSRARSATAPASSPRRWRSRSPARTSRMSSPPQRRRRPRLVRRAPRQAHRRPRTRSPRRSSRRSTSASASSTMSGSTISTSTAPAARSRGGESQRIRLASQIGSGLSGVLYVLDEPSIGLHQKDNDRLLETLKRLRGLGNTVLVVEHDEDAIRHADHVIDMGPGAGVHGGEVVCAGHARRPARLQGQHHRRLPLRPPRDPAPRRPAARAAASTSPSTAPPPTTSRTSPPPSRSAPSPASPGSAAAASRALTIDTLYAGAARALNGARILVRPVQQDHRARAARQGHRHRPVADRPHPALQPRDLHRRLHP